MNRCAFITLLYFWMRGTFFFHISTGFYHQIKQVSVNTQWEMSSLLYTSTREEKRRLSCSYSFCPSKSYFSKLLLYTHNLPWITHHALQGQSQPVINSLTADTNHVWLVSRICCQILPVPCYCLDLCDLAGCPLTPHHMISVCDLWPVWIIKEAWPLGDCIGNLSLMISELVWGKGAQMKASPVFRNVDMWMYMCVYICVCMCLSITSFHWLPL